MNNKIILPPGVQEPPTILPPTLRVRGNRVLVELVPLDSQVGQIHIPIHALADKKPKEAIIRMIGDGDKLPPWLKEPGVLGKRVYIGQFAGMGWKFGNREFAIFAADDLVMSWE